MLNPEAEPVIGAKLIINGADRTVSRREELAACLGEVRDLPFAELWLSRPGGESLAALLSGERGWLMYLQYHGDAGFSSRDPAYVGPRDAVLEFRLSNGQRDEYPVAWTLPTTQVMRVVEYFFTTGERAPWIAWHDDRVPDP